VYRHPLPPKPSGDGWKIKIFDKESGLEPPHVTVMHKARKWRFDLRELKFMDQDPPIRDVPKEIIEALKMRDLIKLRHAWDAIHPNNPVESADA
jgi:hypothetical protein